ncbi:hypothetical protein WA026_017120 [Henosepilachna vigintioctopunctata]|uniref:Uncharacterized protein n=1 Tax=Henosepilachna vigintioctopunctata TaxID=420089 RepID=A0AAW1TW62_9CUCU
MGILLQQYLAFMVMLQLVDAGYHLVVNSDGIIPVTYKNAYLASIVNVIDQRRSEISLTTGKIFTAEESLKTGLTDEMAENTGDETSKSIKFSKQLCFTTAQTKAFFRESTILTFMKNRLKMFIHEIQKETFRKNGDSISKHQKKHKVHKNEDIWIAFKNMKIFLIFFQYKDVLNKYKP